MTHIESIHRFTGVLLNEGQISDTVYRHFRLAAYGDGDRARMVRLEIETEDFMRKRLIGVAGLAVALTLLAGGAGASLHGASAASPEHASRSVYTVGAGLDAGTLYRMAVPAKLAAPDPACAVQGPDSEDGAVEDANDTDNVQDENGADDATEANGEQEAANDTDNLECGDQSEGADASQAASSGAVRASLLNTQIQTDVEAPDGTESASGGDEATDGIQCEQQGEHEGENVGC